MSAHLCRRHMSAHTREHCRKGLPIGTLSAASNDFGETPIQPTASVDLYDAEIIETDAACGGIPVPTPSFVRVAVYQSLGATDAVSELHGSRTSSSARRPLNLTQDPRNREADEIVAIVRKDTDAPNRSGNFTKLLMPKPKHVTPSEYQLLRTSEFTVMRS